MMVTTERTRLRAVAALLLVLLPGVVSAFQGAAGPAGRNADCLPWAFPLR